MGTATIKIETTLAEPGAAAVKLPVTMTCDFDGGPFAGNIPVPNGSGSGALIQVVLPGCVKIVSFFVKNTLTASGLGWALEAEPATPLQTLDIGGHFSFSKPSSDTVVTLVIADPITTDGEYVQCVATGAP
jgi:hypothetical protein